MNTYTTSFHDYITTKSGQQLVVDFMITADVIKNDLYAFTENPVIFSISYGNEYDIEDTLKPLGGKTDLEAIIGRQHVKELIERAEDKILTEVNL